MQFGKRPKKASRVVDTSTLRKRAARILNEAKIIQEEMRPKSRADALAAAKQWLARAEVNVSGDESAVNANLVNAGAYLLLAMPRKGDE